MNKLIATLSTAFLIALQPTASHAIFSAWTLTTPVPPNTTPYTYSTSQGNSPTAEFSGFLGDKQVKYLDSKNIRTDTIFNFIYDSSKPSPWIISLNSSSNTPSELSGNFKFRIRIDSNENGQSICSSLPSRCGPYFATAKLNSATAMSNPDVKIYQTSDPNNVLTTLTPGPESSSYSFQSSYNDLIIMASWQTISSFPTSFSVSFTQTLTPVPAPLPLMATATFFGTFSKIRRLSSKLHQNSKKTA